MLKKAKKEKEYMKWTTLRKINKQTIVYIILMPYICIIIIEKINALLIKLIYVNKNEQIYMCLYNKSY